MNPAVMGPGALSARDALNAVEAELSGRHPGRLIRSSRRPDRAILEKAQGHRQVMDFWLVQVARDAKAKLATRDAGTLRNWPDHTERVA